MKSWQYDRAMDNVRNLPNIHVTVARELNGKLFHMSFTGRTSTPFTPDEIERTVRNLQLTACVLYRDEVGRIIIAQSDVVTQEHLTSLLHKLVSVTPNLTPEDLWSYQRR